MTIKVPKAVFDGITVVRDSGKTNMLDRPMVARLCMKMGHYEAALWVCDNRSEYANGIFQGFEATDDVSQVKG